MCPKTGSYHVGFSTLESRLARCSLKLEWTQLVSTQKNTHQFQLDIQLNRIEFRKKTKQAARHLVPLTQCIVTMQDTMEFMERIWIVYSASITCNKTCHTIESHVYDIFRDKTKRSLIYSMLLQRPPRNSAHQRDRDGRKNRAIIRLLYNGIPWINCSSVYALLLHYSESILIVFILIAFTTYKSHSVG